MEKKTAVDWLVDQIKSDQNQKALSASDWMKVIDQAKQMEKEQIIEAAERWKGTNFAEQYYNETYKSDGFICQDKDCKHCAEDIAQMQDDISYQIEISDEEIEKYAKQNAFQYYEFIIGAKWYREQLKQRL